jgi:hypothetical protein
LNTYVIRIYRPQPYLVVAVFEEVGGVEGERDSMNRVFPMGGLGSYRKVPMRWPQGDSQFPFGAFLYFGQSRFSVDTIRGLASLTPDGKGEGRG